MVYQFNLLRFFVVAAVVGGAALMTTLLMKGRGSTSHPCMATMDAIIIVSIHLSSGRIRKVPSEPTRADSLLTAKNGGFCRQICVVRRTKNEKKKKIKTE